MITGFAVRPSENLTLWAWDRAGGLYAIQQPRMSPAAGKCDKSISFPVRCSEHARIWWLNDALPTPQLHNDQ